jgi:malonyl-CoA O-methyltransferase
MATLDVRALREAYALWAPSYPSAAHNALMRTEQRVVGAAIARTQPARALDLGTGSGRYLTELAAAGATLIVGLDFAPEMLARAPRCGHRVCGDARELPFAAKSFDLVNASLMAGDVDDLSAWTRELASVLDSGGHLIYSDFHPSWQQNGWRRTFQAPDGRGIDLPYVPHTIGDHTHALRSAGLALVSCVELPLEDNEDADTAAFRRRWGNPPVLVVVHARKPER